MDAFDTRFAALTAHLDEVWPTIRKFCTHHGLVHVPTGRYPRILICRAVTTLVTIELEMEWAADGKRFETYTPEREYRLWVGTFHDAREDGHRVRYRLGQVMFEHVPFPQVPAILPDALDRALTIGDRWTTADVLARGHRHVLR